MIFSELPALTAQNAELLAYDDQSNTASRIPNPFGEVMDGIIISLVQSQALDSATLDSHISDSGLHIPISDGEISTTKTWSSSQITSAIAGSDPWFNLDSIPEGSVNQYYTPERGAALVANTTQGVTAVDYQAVATSLASTLLGFNNTVFRYELDSTSDTYITVDGVTTLNYFEVTPGEHTVTVESNRTWVSNELVHQVNIPAGTNETIWITPRLTLDAFTDGQTNKLFNSTTFGESQILLDINDHINENFSDYHAALSDNTFASTTSTWSSSKIQAEVISAIKSNTSSYPATKEVMIAQETSGTGSSPSSYSWTTDDNGDGTYTHHVKRRNTNYDYRDNLTIYSDEFRIRTGTWFIYWVYDETISPSFTNVTNVSTYVADDSTPRVPLLAYPQTYTLSGSTQQDITVVTRFTSDTPYSSSLRNTWLVPKNVPGVGECFGFCHIEKVR